MPLPTLGVTPPKASLGLESSGDLAPPPGAAAAAHAAQHQYPLQRAFAGAVRLYCAAGSGTGGVPSFTQARATMPQPHIPRT